MVSLYSIGHGNRTIDDFVTMLKKYSIEYVIDVRSKPYSRFNPDFSRGTLDRLLTEIGIRYVYMGDSLGGFPDDPSCYTSEGRVDYDKLKLQDTYKRGLERLASAWQQGLNVAIMCSELKPQHCHRSKLIGESLAEADIPVLHIDETGETKNQEQVIDEVKREVLGAPSGQLSLFGDDREFSFTSRKRYTSKRTEGNLADED